MYKVERTVKGGVVADIIKALTDGKDVSVLSAEFGQKTAIASLLPEFVYVCSDYVTARAAFEQISCMREAVYLPALDDVMTFAKIRTGETYNQRIKALYQILKGAKVIVTWVAALMQLFPERELFSSLGFTLEKGSEVELTSLPGRLLRAGYKRVDHIESLGQFAIRGDILDISPVTCDGGVRIEFFGDEIESIKRFDYFTQLSLETMDRAEICPNTVITAQGDVDFSLIKGNKSSIEGDLRLMLENGGNDCALAFIAPLIPHSTFSEFVRLKYIVYEDAKQISDNVSMILHEHNSRQAALALQGAPFVEGQLHDDLGYDGVKLAFHGISNNNRIFAPKAVFTVQPFVPFSYRKNYPQLCGDIKSWRLNGYHVDICCGDSNVYDGIRELLIEKGALLDNVTLCKEKLNGGFVFHEIKQVVIGTYDLISKKRGKKKLTRQKDALIIPQIGEYVVHNVHGIGIMESVSRMTMGGATRDYCIIRYLDDDKLYVPVENIDCLSKYIAGDGVPKLSKIGGVDFAKVKEKVKASVKKMAFSLLNLYAERAQAKGHKYSPDNSFLAEFESAFPYVPTEDQTVAVKDCINDLTSGKIMDRLLCGDVGYGKTEVALRVAFKVIAEGKQVAFVSPTTILAKQHFKTAMGRMNRFGVTMCSLTRMDKPGDIKRDLALLGEGKIDMAIGTHRMLSDDVKFKDLGLLILDEEQRFGVAAKEKLKLMKSNVNVLTLSATPIPRTLHMSMTGIRDMSILDTPPADRIPVQTYVSEYSDSLVYDAVMRELGREGQVFIVYNRVETINMFASRMQTLFGSGVRISVGHGQMKEDVLEKTIDAFVAGESDVLIASTIIENGIDMPRANTMIVIDSDKLGLSQLYQLRGRIGRSNRLAYVFFTYEDKILSETAYKRLEAITQFTEFGSGFKIAMRDLEIRGAGSILGKVQHGHMEKVGYDMYCKILKEAVEELKGGKISSENEVKVSIDFEAFLPEGYISDSARRMDFYSRVSTLSTIEDSKRVYAELRDIYGEVPQPVYNLMTTALVKNLAAAIGATKAVFKKNNAGVYFDKIKDINKNVSDCAKGCSGCIMRLSPPEISFVGAGARKKMINFLINCQL